MKNFLSILIIISSISLKINGQDLKSYSGNYEKGIATYTYYENPAFERIYQGKFLYKVKTDRSYYENVVINGQFSNNLKTGSWKYIGSDINRNSPSDKLIIEGIYNENKKNGIWKATKTFKNNGKIFKKEIVANFENDKLVGDFSYFDSKSQESVKGRFDENGNYDGEWKTIQVMDGNKFEEIKKFKKGVLYYRLTRNTSTGEIYNKENFTEILPYIIYANDSTVQGLSIELGYYYSFKKLNDKVHTKMPYYIRDLEFGTIKYWSYGYFEDFNDVEKLFFDYPVKEETTIPIGGEYYIICHSVYDGHLLSNEEFQSLISGVK